MYLGGDPLEEDIVFRECFAEIGGTFIVQDVEFRGMPEMEEMKMSCFPRIPNGGSEAIWNGKRVNGVGIEVIQEENVVIAASGRCVEVSRLIRVGFQEGGFRDEHGTNLM
jgi:hypothetical protein